MQSGYSTAPANWSVFLLEIFDIIWLCENPKEIIILMRHYQHGSLWTSLATRLYRPSLPGGLPGYILYRNRGSCWSSFLCSSMWRGPQEYITHEFVLTSPAVSPMSSSFTLDSFRVVVDGRTAAVLWSVASQNYSIQLVAFLCKCRQAFSPYVYLASMWCIPIPVSTRLLLGKKNCVLFYRSGLTSIWLIGYR